MANKYKNLIIGLGCLVLLGGFFAADFFGSEFFASVLNNDNVVSFTNKFRKSANLPELKISRKLALAAEKKAEDMLENQYFAHTSPSGKTPWDFMEDAGYDYLFAGENLAIYFNSAEDVMKGWLTSPEHKENIASDKYAEIGVGVAKGKFLNTDATVVVQMFGKNLLSNASNVKNNMSAAPQKSRLAKNQKNQKKFIARASAKPAVKGASIANYISQLENQKMAVWIPAAKLQQSNNQNLILICLASAGLFIFLFAHLRVSADK